MPAFKIESLATEGVLQKGDILQFDGYLGKAIVLAVHSAGTIDVERLSDGKCFRISGLEIPSVVVKQC